MIRKTELKMKTENEKTIIDSKEQGTKEKISRRKEKTMREKQNKRKTLAGL